MPSAASLTTWAIPSPSFKAAPKRWANLIKEDALDKRTELEFLGMITDGTQMLNSLRLSLMEQTRVLEGKPILVDSRATDVRRLVEAGARYQQPKHSTGRRITLEGEDLHLCVDELRFITRFHEPDRQRSQVQRWRSQGDVAHRWGPRVGRGARSGTEGPWGFPRLRPRSCLFRSAASKRTLKSRGRALVFCRFGKSPKPMRARHTLKGTPMARLIPRFSAPLRDAIPECCSTVFAPLSSRSAP